MNGLRVYIRAVVSNVDGTVSAFYSRRGNGPFYQWRFDEKVSAWSCSRLNSSELNSRAFYLASWKSLPRSLQTRLSEHYIE